jgi:hypothetical protein
MIDPVGSLIAELRAAGIASGRVYGGEAPPGQPRSPDAYQRFVVLSRLSTIRLHRTPLEEVRLGLRCYGSTYQDAAALFGEVSDAIDNGGPRISATNVGIYQSLDEGSSEAAADPGTGQPFEAGVIALWVATEAVA